MKTSAHFSVTARILRIVVVLVATTVAMCVLPAVTAQARSPQIGIVIMHGKAGLPSGLVAELAAGLQGKGYLVANLEMPWSKRRQYDVTVSDAEKEVDAALDSLKRKGAKKLFIAGHSQGGVFALYLGGKQRVDGIVAIAPGGHVGNVLFREKLGSSVEHARRLIAEGKGAEKTALTDFEGSKGTFPVHSAPAVYLSWFDPEGAMNQETALKTVNAQVPVLYIAPTRDYPGLLKVKHSMYALLPRHPLTKLYEPQATHVDAPSASRDEIVRWISEVSARH